MPFILMPCRVHAHIQNLALMLQHLELMQSSTREPPHAGSTEA